MFLQCTRVNFAWHCAASLHGDGGNSSEVFLDLYLTVILNVVNNGQRHMQSSSSTDVAKVFTAKKKRRKKGNSTVQFIRSSSSVPWLDSFFLPPSRLNTWWCHTARSSSPASLDRSGAVHAARAHALQTMAVFLSISVSGPSPGLVGPSNLLH